MFSINKHSYLHNYHADINPGLINRCVDKAFGFTSLDVHDLEPPFQRLCSEQPNIPVQNLDVIHRPIGYGRGAMVKLRHDLSDHDDLVVAASLESITELVIDSEWAFEAIKLRLIERLVNLLMHDNAVIRERSAIVLWKIAKLAKAREIIVANKALLNNVSFILEDQCEAVRVHAAKMLSTVAESWTAADELIKFGFITILLQIIKDKEEKYIILIHLGTLKSLMYSMTGKSVAMEYHGFDVMLDYITDENTDVSSEALYCLAQMTTTCLGEKLAREKKLMATLDSLLHDERASVHTATASVIMFCTVKAAGKMMAAEYPRIVPRLLQLAQNFQNPSTQMYSIKALTNISENPKIRRLLQEKYSQELGRIQIKQDEDIEMWKTQLMDVVSWVP
ncbi:unnamed protein product [Phyllotreta striolata]|uniref:Condensin complex subunit 1 C-terminal domain-containing protein n=1 Tax=Phyllotreta striolata TaxID=444603 RepID=A0A9N9TJP6_PHYSR|nr:unnamed protein product [Phyllotreta striolata]